MSENNEEVEYLIKQKLAKEFDVDFNKKLRFLIDENLFKTTYAKILIPILFLVAVSIIGGSFMV